MSTHDDTLVWKIIIISDCFVKSCCFFVVHICCWQFLIEQSIQFWTKKVYSSFIFTFIFKHKIIIKPDRGPFRPRPHRSLPLLPFAWAAWGWCRRARSRRRTRWPRRGPDQNIKIISYISIFLHCIQWSNGVNTF